MRLYRLLLRLLPASFRAEYGEEMCAVFAARRRGENTFALWIATLLDVFTTAIRVHADLLWQDLSWTLRTLRQSPGFTFTAIGVAALGMGATTAAYTLLDHVLLRPLPYPQSEQIVMLYQTKDHVPIYGSWPNISDWCNTSKSFESVGVFTPLSANLSGQGEPRRLLGVGVTSEAIRGLRIAPAIGRGFTGDDDRRESPNVVVLSDDLSVSLFGNAADALGRTIRLDDQIHTVIGVMPAGFAFPSRETQFWTQQRYLDPDRSNIYLGAVARLRPGISVKQAQGEMDVIAKQLERAYPKDNPGMGAAVVALRDVISPQSRTLVLAVFGAAVCVMLIACTNLANLLFARAMVRRREIAVRIALGAGRERLLRQLFTENVVLAVAGGTFGWVLAALATPSLALLVPDTLPIRGVPQLDLRIFLFAAALTLITSLVFGVGPALRTCRQVDLNALRPAPVVAGQTACGQLWCWRRWPAR